MSYADWKEQIDDQTANAASYNGISRHIGDCVLGIGADGTGSGPLYIDGGTLKLYTFAAFVDGYYANVAASSDLGVGSAGLNHIHLAYVETSDAGVEGRVAGSISSVAFSIVYNSTTSTPAGYDGSMVLGYATDAAGDNTWTLLTCHNSYPTFIRGIIAPTVDGRDVSADGANLDKHKLFYAEKTGLAQALGNSTWLAAKNGNNNTNGWKFDELAGAKVLVTAVLEFTRQTPDSGG